MRTAIAGPVTPLLGSLGLHGGVLLALLIAVRPPRSEAELHHERLDSWAGNAVEVDAIATPDLAASLPNAAPATAHPEATEAPEPAAAARVDKPEGALARSKPRPAAPSSRAPVAPQRAAERSARASAATAVDPGSRVGAVPPVTGAFGSEGLPPGVRSLPSAFTRAIPPATGADPIWQTLPTGTERPFTIAIEVDADGHIKSAEILKEKDGAAAEPQAVHLRERVVALLSGGLFALQNDVAAGRESFRITVTLSDRPVHDQDDPAELVERGFDPPRGAAPGRAYFTLASGRHFEAKVQVLARP